MFYTDNPVMDAERYIAEQDAEIEKLPKCCDCDEPIQQETAVYINDEYICDDCLSSYRREVMAEW